ncbi:MAG TPA: hypothetical protein VJ796_07255 [Acidimicrobiia bacterium]|nr:hypothetical protein [Acidimicrobiia bacterium]
MPTDRALDIQGPVRGEVFVVFEEGSEIFLTGPDGPRPWLIETHGRENPMEEIRRTATSLLPDMFLLHSTSWRWEGTAVVLTFIAAVAKGSGESRRISDAGHLARGSATAPPAEIASDQVLNHALRHLAWLGREDEVVRDSLSAGWREALLKYVPATFQQIG